jgi:hypothetical protein
VSSNRRDVDAIRCREPRRDDAGRVELRLGERKGAEIRRGGAAHRCDRQTD